MHFAAVIDQDTQLPPHLLRSEIRTDARAFVVYAQDSVEEPAVALPVRPGLTRERREADVITYPSPLPGVVVPTGVDAIF